MKLFTTYFSATSTTKTIVTKIAQQLCPTLLEYDVTSNPLSENVNLTSDDLLVVGMPVYAGRIPVPAVESLKRFKGAHTPAIVVAVYGNREFDDIFVEMQDILETNGFFIIAAGAFIAQHSIFPHTAQGRPDQADHLKIAEFAARCETLLKKGFSTEAKSIRLPGNRPYKIPGNIPLKVITNSNCVACQLCVKNCPVKAIPSDNPRLTDYAKCIHCGKCIHVCPKHARHYGGLLYTLVGTLFGYKNRKRKEPEFFF